MPPIPQRAAIVLCLLGLALAPAGITIAAEARPFEPTRRYPRVDYVWPFDDGPSYGNPATAHERRAGLLRTLVGTFDLIAGPPELPPALTTDLPFAGRPTGYFVVLVDPHRTGGAGVVAMERSIREHGGEVVHTVPVAGYIVRLTEAAREHLSGLAGVLAVEPYHAAFKLSPAIGRSPHVDPVAARSPVYELDVVLFPGEDATRVVESTRNDGGSILGGHGDWLHIRLHRDRLAGVASLQAVRAVFEHMPVEPLGEEVAANLETGRYLGGVQPYRDIGIDGGGGGVAGADPIVMMVLDSGIQLDSAEVADTRTDAGTPGPGHRKVRFNGTTMPFGGGGDLLGCEPITHGQLVSAVALGAASTVPLSYGEPWPDYEGRRRDGVAPGALLASYDAEVCGSSFLVGDLYTAPSSGSMPHAYTNHGTRIYNFSWGSGGNTYNSFALDADQFLHDHEEAMAFVSAGNSGPGSSTVLSPGLGKNLLGIGATMTGPSPTLDQDDRWNPSSKGPVAASNRVAPTLMAPGSDVGTLDSPHEIYWCQTSDDDQSNPVECLPGSGSSGTSEASPAAAGTAALFLDYMQQGFYPDGTRGDAGNAADRVTVVSGALVKSALIASADWVGDGNRIGGNMSVPYRHNNEQGYGRIQLTNVMKLSSWAASPPGLILHDGGVAGGVSDLALPTTVDAVGGEQVGTTFEVVDGSRELRVALSWIEDAGDFLINDLDLLLSSPDGKVYGGNYFTDDNDRNGALGGGEDCPGIDGGAGALDASPWSLPTCPSSVADTKHATEAIYLSPDADADGDDDADFHQVPAGTWSVLVRANAGGTDPTQRFALAISGGVTVEGTIVLNETEVACGGSFSFKVLETDEADDPASGLNAAEIAGRVSVEVVNGAGTLMDVESGFSVAQPDLGVLRFDSSPIVTVLAPPTPGNGAVEVDAGDRLRVVYGDESSGAPDPLRRQQASAAVVCTGFTPSEAVNLVVAGFDPATSDIAIGFGPACFGVDHTIVHGPLSQVSTYGYTGQTCDVGDDGTATFDPGAGSFFFVVVGNDSDGVEGSYGTDSDGGERPEMSADPACALLQDLSQSCN